jgi:Spy/CpxP family protein refolding chaperone
MAINLKSGLAFAGAVLTLLVGAPALAQPPPGGGPGFGFGGGQFGGGGSVSSAPIAALEVGLKLTAEQKTKIIDIQKQTTTDRNKMMQELRNGGQPDQAAFQAFMQKMQTMNKEADKKITDLLTPEQKKLLPAVLKDIQTLSAVGIPAPTMGDLKLTDDQKKKIADIAAASQKTMQEKMQEARQSGDFQAIREIMMTNRKETHDKALAVLTEDQKKIVAKYEKEHPQQPGRGFGPGGGPPPGGPPPFLI